MAKLTDSQSSSVHGGRTRRRVGGRACEDQQGGGGQDQVEPCRRQAHAGGEGKTGHANLASRRRWLPHWPDHHHGGSKGDRDGGRPRRREGSGDKKRSGAKQTTARAPRELAQRRAAQPDPAAAPRAGSKQALVI